MGRFHLSTNAVVSSGIWVVTPKKLPGLLFILHLCISKQATRRGMWEFENLMI